MWNKILYVLGCFCKAWKQTEQFHFYAMFSLQTLFFPKTRTPKATWKKLLHLYAVHLMLLQKHYWSYQNSLLGVLFWGLLLCHNENVVFGNSYLGCSLLWQRCVGLPGEGSLTWGFMVVTEFENNVQNSWRGAR